MALADWPVLKRYEGAFLDKIALPIGGIGTGAITLGGRGDLRDWEIVNRSAKGFAPAYAFWALHARPANADSSREPVTRCLEGPLSPGEYEGPHGSPARNHGLPRFGECAFETAYPFGIVRLSDAEVPVRATLGAFNPLVPGDAEASGHPVAVLRWEIENTSGEPLQITVCGSMHNFVGTDGTEGAPKDNVNEFRDEAGVRGVFGFSRGVAQDSPGWGTLALASLDADASISHRTRWPEMSWGGPILDFWDDLSADGRLDDLASTYDGDSTSTMSLAATVTIAPGETRALTFLVAWHFPNRQSWTPQPDADNTIGNFYTQQSNDAWDAALQFAPQLPALEEATLDWTGDFCMSDMPDVLKEAALFNLSTLRTQTCFRTPDGRFWGWEGCNDNWGSCHGNCTHVWNYEQATSHLFGDWARSMREIEFAQATDARGFMDFRVSLPLGRASQTSVGEESGHKVAAADGQLGCIMKLHRDWQLSGDDALLRALWPHARRALEFAWIEKGWDGDRDGVMEGCQHNTMDVEYYGPNPEMQSWYLGTLRAAEEMSKYLGEHDFAQECRRVFESGRAWTDANLWNGDYYEHEIRPPHSAENIAPGLRLGAGATDMDDPELQLGAGCLIDQLVGCYMARVSGLGELLDAAHVDKTFDSLLEFNFQDDMKAHFNPMRSYALAGESAMLIASYPRGRRPKRPFPYFYEAWTGLEYIVAAHLIYEGRREDGLKLLEAVRARYDGRKRSPFNEGECGHHYARALASWACVLAWTGFGFSAVTQEIRFRATKEDSLWFWSNGSAWGTIEQNSHRTGARVALRVERGELKLRALELTGVGRTEWDETQIVGAGDMLECGVGSVD